MKNPYAVLGINETADDVQIKSAFKRLSMLHHPDRGGDEYKFKELVEAYEYIKQYRDRSRVTSTFENVTHRYRPTAKNADISITYEITYDEIVTGMDTIVRIALPYGRFRDVRINIPAGVKHGHRIKFPECGDDSIHQLYPGDLYVTIVERKSAYFMRIDNDCHIKYLLHVKDAMLGNKVIVTGLLDKKYSVSIPPGTQHNSKFRIPGAGFPVMNSTKSGDLIITIEINIPIVKDDTIPVKNL